MFRPRPSKYALGLLGLTLALLGACEASTPGSSTDDDDDDASAPSGGAEGELDVPGDGGGPAGTGGSAGSTSVMVDCARTEVSATDTTTAQPADIVIMVDTSPSMLEEIGFVQNNLNAFSQRIIDSGVDVRVIMVAEAVSTDPAEDDAIGICIDPPLGSGSCPEDSQPPNYVHLPQAVGSSDSLDVLMRTKNEWITHIRPEALTALFVVSDDDAAYPRSIIYGDPPRYEDIDFMSNHFFDNFSGSHHDLLDPWSFNGVYPFSECANADKIGKVYTRLVELTDGVAGDLCEQDFEPIFDRFATRVIEDAVTLACEWEIPAPVEEQTFSTELVKITRASADGAEQDLFQVPRAADCAVGGWYFDDPTNPSHILACPETCEALQSDLGGKIRVVFDCELVEGCSASGAGTLDEGSEPVACEWPMPEAEDAGSIVDPDSLNVRYVTHGGFGVLLGQVDGVDDCASAEQGWYYDAPEAPASIVACPSTCETLRSANVAKVEALFGCKTKPAVVR